MTWDFLPFYLLYAGSKCLKYEITRINIFVYEIKFCFSINFNLNFEFYQSTFMKTKYLFNTGAFKQIDRISLSYIWKAYSNILKLPQTKIIFFHDKLSLPSKRKCTINIENICWMLNRIYAQRCIFIVDWYKYEKFKKFIINIRSRIRIL